MLYTHWKEKITLADVAHASNNGTIEQRLLWRDKYIAGLESEIEKRETWKPDNEDLAALQEQARARDGSYTNGLAAQSAYIGGLEARLRTYESNSALTWANSAFTKLRVETDKRTPVLPGSPDLLDELIAQLEHVEAQLAAVSAEREALRELRDEIESWLKMFSADIFQEPDFKRASELLKAGGMTLDSVSASNMRHVLTRLLEKYEQTRAARDTARAGGEV